MAPEVKGHQCVLFFSLECLSKDLPVSICSNTRAPSLLPSEVLNTVCYYHTDDKFKGSSLKTENTPKSLALILA